MARSKAAPHGIAARFTSACRAAGRSSTTIGHISWVKGIDIRSLDIQTKKNIDLSKPEMTAEDVLEVVKLFEQNQIVVILDGGWAVDALLGEPTRRHADLG